VSRLSEYHGFKHGDLIEARYQPDADEPPGDWQLGVFVAGDADDPVLSYAVRWGDDEPSDMYDYSEWIRPGNLRKRGAPDQPIVWEFRTRESYEDWSAWKPVSAGVFYGPADEIDFRKRPERTDAEILTKLREYAETTNISQTAASILRGEF
jgi:hypothetical protein